MYSCSLLMSPKTAERTKTWDRDSPSRVISWWIEIQNAPASGAAAAAAPAASSAACATRPLKQTRARRDAREEVALAGATRRLRARLTAPKRGVRDMVALPRNGGSARRGGSHLCFRKPRATIRLPGRRRNHRPRTVRRRVLKLPEQTPGDGALQCGRALVRVVGAPVPGPPRRARKESKCSHPRSAIAP